jgi:hypothetical protein
MSHDEWALAQDSKELFSIFYGTESNVEQVLAGNANGDSDTTE